jgi:hypothetical protein
MTHLSRDHLLLAVARAETWGAVSRALHQRIQAAMSNARDTNDLRTLTAALHDAENAALRWDQVKLRGVLRLRYEREEREGQAAWCRTRTTPNVNPPGRFLFRRVLH